VTLAPKIIVAAGLLLTNLEWEAWLLNLQKEAYIAPPKPSTFVSAPK
jgi:hypothetical protein